MKHHITMKAAFVFVFAVATVIFAAEVQKNQGNSPDALSSLRSQLIGSWRCVINSPEEPNASLNLTLAADGSWIWSVVTTNKPSTENFAGTWFVHDRAVVLRLDDKAPKMWTKMAFVFDVESVTSQSWTATNSPFGGATWTRIKP